MKHGSVPGITIYVNGVLCKTKTDACLEIKRITGAETGLWTLERLLDGRKQIEGLQVIGWAPPKETSAAPRKISTGRKPGGPLLVYPAGHCPLEYGLPERWV